MRGLKSRAIDGSSMPRRETPTTILTLKQRTIGPAAMLFLDRLRHLARTLEVWS